MCFRSRLEVGAGAVAQMGGCRPPRLDVLGERHAAGVRIDPVAGTDVGLDGGQVGAGRRLGVEGLGPLATERVAEASSQRLERGARRIEPMAFSSAVRRPASWHRAQRLRGEGSAVDERFDPGGLEPAGDLVGIEAYAPAAADVGDPPLVDQAPDVAVGDAEVLGQLRDVEQMRQAADGLPIAMLAAALFHTDLRASSTTERDDFLRGARDPEQPKPIRPVNLTVKALRTAQTCQVRNADPAVTRVRASSAPGRSVEQRGVFIWARAAAQARAASTSFRSIYG